MKCLPLLLALIGCAIAQFQTASTATPTSTSTPLTDQKDPTVSAEDGNLVLLASLVHGKRISLDAAEIVLMSSTKVMLNNAKDASSSYFFQDVPNLFQSTRDDISKVGESVAALRTELMAVINAQKTTIDAQQARITTLEQTVQRLATTLDNIAAENKRQQTDFDILIQDLETACFPGLEYETAPATATSARQCALVTPCPAGQYETQAPTETSNRVCSGHTVCPDGMYAAKVGSDSADTVCTPWTDCKPSEYELIPPSASSNRVCKPVTQCVLYSTFALIQATSRSDNFCFPALKCKANEYASTQATLTSDRICSPVSPACTASQWEAQSPVQIGVEQRDRICRPLTTCDPAYQYETKAATLTSDRICQNMTICNTNSEFQSVAPTATSDRKCQALTVCAVAVQFQAAAPTATSDRICQNVRGPCAVGEIETPATPTSDRLCRSPLPSQCFSYVNIDALAVATRSPSSATSVQCDTSGDVANNVGRWIRFVNLGSGKIPDTTPPQLGCNTHAPGWISTGHPTTPGEVRGATACFHWSNGPCTWTTNIQITNCNGFFLYNLVVPPGCSMRYCVE